MVLEKRKFFIKRKLSTIYLFISNCFRIIGATMLIVVTSIIVCLSCLFEKVWHRNNKAKVDEMFIVKIAKSICALFIIISSTLLLIIVTSLSYIFKKTTIGQNEAKKEEKRIKEILYTTVNFVLSPIVKIFSFFYEFCWSLWDRLDRK